ncbi:MAG: thymidylate synthase [Vicinamibacterales bacterium]
MTARVITAHSVDQALEDGIWWLRSAGVAETSRNGPVLVAPGPVITQYQHPQNRVIFSPKRDANPVFHLVEALWMLAGRNTVEDLAPYTSGIQRYAEADGHMHGAYGHRWREHFPFDQLWGTVQLLVENPDTRQAVMAMWSPEVDFRVKKNDIPCNTHIYFDLRGGKLNMTVCCRSNDMLLGAYGANVAHMSVMMEWIAAAVGVPLGVYTQMSNNFHVYTESEVWQRVRDVPDKPRHYPSVVPLLAMGEDPLDFLEDCEYFFNGSTVFKTYFMQHVAYPLATMYQARKRGEDWTDRLALVPECDWKVAFNEWCLRRVR